MLIDILLCRYSCSHHRNAPRSVLKTPPAYETCTREAPAAPAA
jgi:hypothetical protein